MPAKRAAKSATPYVSAGPHIALLARITQDKSGRVLGVKRQKVWGYEYCAKQWPGIPVVVYDDNDITAADINVVRPQYDLFRAAVRNGDVLGVWCVEWERLERVESRWFELAAELEASGVSEIHTRDNGIVDITSVTAGILAVLAGAEVRKVKKRVARTLDQNAANGQPPGSRPYGYRHGETERGVKTYVIVPDEAAIIQESADRFLAGWSFVHIAADLTRRGIAGPRRVKVKDATGEVATVGGRSVEDGGVPVTRPSKLSGPSVKSWLTSAAVAGRRIHRGLDVGVGNWPAILDADTVAAIADRIKAPHRVTRSDGKGTYPVNAGPKASARRYLLTGGIAFCSVCDARLVAQVVADPTRGKVPNYMCSKSHGGKGCVTIMADQTEAFVAAELLAMLAQPEFAAALAADDYAELRDAITTSLRAIEGRRKDGARMWARGQWMQSEWEAAREVLDEDERAARLALAAVPAPSARIDAAQIIEDWAGPDMTLDERREIVRMFIDHVVIGKAKPGANRFDVGRITVVFRRGQRVAARTAE